MADLTSARSKKTIMKKNKNIKIPYNIPKKNWNKYSTLTKYKIIELQKQKIKIEFKNNELIVYAKRSKH